MNLRKELSLMKREGLGYVEKWASPRTWDIAYLFLIFLFTILIFVTTVLSVVSRGGFLFGAMRMPLWTNFMLLAEDPLVPARDHIEQGSHWSTLLMLSWAWLIMLIRTKKAGYRPVHMLVYSAMVTYGIMVFPFEWTYTTLLDIFHNLPVEGIMSTTTYGLWRWEQPWMLIHSVIGRNGLVLMGFVFAHFVSLDNFHRWNFWCWREIYHFDKICLILFVSIYAMFGLWVALPEITPIKTDMTMVTQFNYTQHYPWWNYTEDIPQNYGLEEPIKGTPFFPQTIYVWYGVHPDNQVDPYDIIHEEWHPNVLVRFINFATKALTILWGIWTFSPRSKEEQLKRWQEATAK